MRYRLLALAGAVLLGLAPLSAMADDEKKLNAMLECYKGVMLKLDDASNALNYMLLIFLAAVCVAVLFKNAKRTHLD